MASERTCFQIKDSFSFSSNSHSLLFCLTSDVSMRLLGSQLIRIMRLKFVIFFRDRGPFFFSEQFQSCECNKSIINQTCSRFYWENISPQSFFFIRTSLFSHYGHRARLVRYSQAYLVCFFVDSFGNAQIFIENLQPQKVFTVEVNKEQKLYITSAKTIFYSK